MKKKRCKICGEKLIDGYCQGCGLQERYTEVSSEAQSLPKPKKKTAAVIWSGVCIVLILLPWIFRTTPFQMIVSGVRSEQVMTSIPESEYADVSRELSAEGATAELTLDEGNYIVGIDIPEGIYKTSALSRGAMLELEDEENQIDIFSHLRKDSESTSSYLENVRLYKGAVICIENGQIEFSSSNAQVESLQILKPNESTESYSVKDGAVAGADFPEGTYDITVSGDGYGMVTASHPDRNEEALGFSNTMGADEGDLKRFRNVEFPKGTLIEIADVEITLVPSVRNSVIR